MTKQTTATPDAEPGIDDVALFKKLDFMPHSPAQWEYCTSTARFNIPNCGRRWGKSQAAGHRMTKKMFVPDSYNWIVGPTYKLGEKEFRVVWNDFKRLGLLSYCKKSNSVHQGDMRIETPWGSVLEVVSADRQDSLLGEGLSHAIMSEAAKHSRNTYEQFIEPALSDLRGSCDFPSTPKGYNWYHGLWELGQDPNEPLYKSWHLPSWTNPVRYPGGFENDEIQRIKSHSSEIWFAQEYGAEFTAVTGSIYSEFSEKIHVTSAPFHPEWPNYQAFDYGFANPFVCLDIQVTPSDDVIVWREYHVRQLSTYEHGIALRDRYNPPGYHVDGKWGDPRGADEAATLALVYGHVASEDVPWKHGVEALKRLMKVQPDGFPKFFVDHSCINTIRSLRKLHVRELSNRGPASADLNERAGDQNIQHKVDDHEADALRYFIGPYFVLGANSHLSDLYGTDYHNSESQDFLTLHRSVTLSDQVSPFTSISDPY